MEKQLLLQTKVSEVPHLTRDANSFSKPGAMIQFRHSSQNSEAGISIHEAAQRKWLVVLKDLWTNI